MQDGRGNDPRRIRQVHREAQGSILSVSWGCVRIEKQEAHLAGNPPHYKGNLEVWGCGFVVESLSGVHADGSGIKHNQFKEPRQEVTGQREPRVSTQFS